MPTKAPNSQPPALPAVNSAVTSAATTKSTASAAQYVQQKAAGSGSSFYYAFLFLPPQPRAAITAFYAFCREVDDVVDEVSDASVAAQKLAWWQREVAQSFAGSAHHPVMQALMPHTAAYGITQQQLETVIAGCEMDLNQTRYLDYAALDTYCYRVAGVVGEVCSQIFSAGQSAALTLSTQDATGLKSYALALGTAMQLTNIIRDVGEDAQRGRIYLPVDELQRFDVKAHEILNSVHSERFVALMQFQAARAYAAYNTALAALPPATARAQKPGLMMASIYRSLLDEIVAQRFDVLTHRTRLTPLRKLWLAWKTQALGVVSGGKGAAAVASSTLPA